MRLITASLGEKKIASMFMVQSSCICLVHLCATDHTGSEGDDDVGTNACQYSIRKYHNLKTINNKRKSLENYAKQLFSSVKLYSGQIMIKETVTSELLTDASTDQSMK